MSLTNRDPSRESTGVSMDLMSLVRLTVRHWRVTVPAAAVTVLLVVAVFMLASPTYAASASVALFSPPTASDTAETPDAFESAGENPYTRYGDLAVVADIVARKMNSDAERVALEADGVTGYEVVANRLQRGPVVEVTGTGPTAAAAIGSAEAVVERFDSILTEMQEAEGADPAYFITSGQVEGPATAIAQVGSTVRTAIAAIAVGGLATLGLAVLAEAISRRRDTTSAEEVPDGASDPAPRHDERQVPPPSAGPRAAAPAGDPDHDRSRAPAGTARSASTASSPADGRRPRSSGGRSSASDRSPSGGRSSGTGRSSSGGRSSGTGRSSSGGRSSSRVASTPAADRAEENREDWSRWLPSSGAFVSENGHKKPTNDRSS